MASVNIHESLKCFSFTACRWHHMFHALAIGLNDERSAD